MSDDDEVIIEEFNHWTRPDLQSEHPFSPNGLMTVWWNVSL